MNLLYGTLGIRKHGLMVHSGSSSLVAYRSVLPGVEGCKIHQNVVFDRRCRAEQTYM